MHPLPSCCKRISAEWGHSKPLHLRMADLLALKQADMECWLRRRDKPLPKDKRKAQQGDLEIAHELMTADSTEDLPGQKIYRALMVDSCACCLVSFHPLQGCTMLFKYSPAGSSCLLLLNFMYKTQVEASRRSANTEHHRAFESAKSFERLCCEGQSQLNLWSCISKRFYKANHTGTRKQLLD